MIKISRQSAISLLISLTLSLSGAYAQAARVVSLGGSVTEIVYALGAEEQLVGTDQSSLYPQAAQQLPSVGYYRQLPIEGVASLKPTLVIASEHAGPPQVLEQLRNLNIHVMRVSDSPSLGSLQQRVRDVAQALDRVARGEVLLKEFALALAQAKTKTVNPLRAVTVVMRGGKLLGAGRDTAAGIVLEEAGLINALAEQVSYRPLSAEALSMLAPEVIVVTSGTVASMGGLQSVKNSPALKHTPAVAHDRVIVLDDLLAQGFGLRLPQAVSQIRQELSLAAAP